MRLLFELTLLMNGSSIPGLYIDTKIDRMKLIISPISKRVARKTMKTDSHILQV